SIDEEFENRQNLTDQILQQSVIWIDRGISLYELQYIPSLEKAMKIYRTAYEKSGGDITQINLSALKIILDSQLDGEYNLYLVNADGLVVKTTFPDDIGLDFKMWPKFYTYVSQIRKNGTFVPDRMVRGYAKNAPFRKFAYMGTGDGRYLLEISRSFNQLLPSASNASYKELIHNLPGINTDIRSIELYNSRYEPVSRYSVQDNGSMPKADVISKIIRTFKDHTNFEEIDPVTGDVVRYTHLPISDTSSPSASEMYLAARTVYSTEGRDQKKLTLTLIFGGFLLLTAIIAAGGAIAGSRYLSRPIDRIVEDIEHIAAGDLDYRIRPTGSSEFRQIERAINRLVTNLKDTISNLQTREEELLQELGKRWKAEENYQRLFESANEAIFILKGNRIAGCNNAATRLIGRNINEIVGKELHEFSSAFQPDGRESHVASQDIIRRVAQGELSVLQWDFLNKDGKIVKTEAKCSAILSGDDVLIMIIFHDVTELLEMRKREITAIAQIEENLVKLAAINDQIRNPLAAITILNEMQGGQYEEKILEQIRIIDDLINEVDKNFMNTDKVRLFLTKHYGI
ncbi:MAG TPA: HAMP domain-containing protein, partial [Methanospirillum sp.]|nr:HAMP domain-containing protein [Methanospirillum sp.]